MAGHLVEFAVEHGDLRVSANIPQGLKLRYWYLASGTQSEHNFDQNSVGPLAGNSGCNPVDILGTTF